MEADEQQKIKKYIIYGILVSLALILLYVWLSFGLVRITATKHEGITDAVSFKAMQVNDVEKGMFGVGDFYFVPRTSKTIKASAGNYTTIGAIKSLPYFGSSSMELSLYKDRNATKESSDAPGCIAYGKDTGKLVSYDCTSPSALLHFDMTSWKNNELEDIPENTFAISPYRSGIIGILIGGETDQPIFHITPEGKTTYYSKPESLGGERLSSTSVITDRSSENSYFVLKTQAGTLYYGTGEGSYKKIDAPDNFDARYDAMFCSLVTKTLYCYYGPTSDSEDSEEASEHRAKSPAGYIRTTNLDTNEQQIEKLDNEGIDSIVSTRDGHLYGQSQDTLYSLKERGQTPKRVFIDDGVISMSANDSVYFNKSDALYKSEDFQSYKIFSSPNIHISSITTLDDGVFFNAYIQKERELGTENLHTFRLTDEIHNDGLRLIDRMPFPTSYFLISNDFNQNKIRIQIASSITSDRETGVTSYDEIEFDRNKQAALEMVRSSGISTDKYTFDFVH
jgi:hypothetical protein